MFYVKCLNILAKDFPLLDLLITNKSPKFGNLLFVLISKGITCTGIWNSDLEMIVYIVFSCILEYDLFVKIFLGKSVCLCPFNVSLWPWIIMIMGWPTDLIRDPMEKIGLCLWMVNISLQQVNITIVLNTFDVGC